MKYQIFIISDGTGRTAEQAVNAALIQFEDTEVQLNIRPHIRTKHQIVDVMNEARDQEGIIVHTVVSKNLRDAILDLGRLHDVGTIDLMGPLLAQLSQHFSGTPSEKPGLFHQLNRAYFQRIEAMEFTLRHDDGQRIEELEKAEIILLGVSRTFKTPLSIYLAFKGWMVANVPIIMDLQPPDILQKIDGKRIFCLTTSAHRLAALRSIRDRHLGGATGDYADPHYVRREIQFALDFYKKQPNWYIIEITNKPIEEIASEILFVIRERNSNEKESHF